MSEPEDDFIPTSRSWPGHCWILCTSTSFYFLTGCCFLQNMSQKALCGAISCDSRYLVDSCTNDDFVPVCWIASEQNEHKVYCKGYWCWLWLGRFISLSIGRRQATWMAPQGQLPSEQTQTILLTEIQRSVWAHMYTTVQFSRVLAKRWISRFPNPDTYQVVFCQTECCR